MRIAHLLPRQRGNVAVDNYTMADALLWMCRTGAPWQDLPECFGKWSTVHQRSDRWSRNGVIERLFTALQEERTVAVEAGVLAMDSTSVKVHRHAAASPKRGGLPVRRRLPGRTERRSSRGIGRRGHGRRDPSEPGRRARRGPRAPLHGRARRVHGRAPAHGPRVRGRPDPPARGVVRAGAGRAARTQPHDPMGVRQGRVSGGVPMFLSTLWGVDVSGFRPVVVGALRPAGGVRRIPGPRSGREGGLLVEGAVFEHAVDHVAAAAGEADDGGVVVFALFPFAFVVGDRGRMFRAGDERGLP